MKAFLLVHPIAFEIWFRARAAWFLVGRRLGLAVHRLEINWPAPGFFDRVVTHNYANRWLFNRQRTEKLMNVLRCVGQASQDSRVLVIGPRNEAELLLLSLYGFDLNNIVAIDLFSYSPRIVCMDMHKMEFPSDMFDIVYVSWVLKYSYDLQQACAEILRVVRDGGLIAVGWSLTRETSALVGKGSELSGGLEELYKQFATHVDFVYWQDSERVDEGSGDCMVTSIFRVRK